MLLKPSAAMIFLIWVGLSMQACSSASIPSTIAPTNPPIPVLPTHLSPTAPTQTLQPTTTHFISTSTPTQTITPVPDPIRQTPATLMLHRKNVNFDAVQFLSDFIGLLKKTGLRVTTYRELANEPTLSFTKKGQLCIITIDDIYLRYPIDPSVKEMIQLLQTAGYPAVLGVITEGNYTFPETVQILSELQKQGWEIASHTDTHRNLADVEKIAPKSIYPEIKTSLDKLETAFGLRPITLILPDGQMTRGDQQIKRSGVLWVVGIGGGNQYDTGKAFYYVGREGPDGTAQETLAIMLKRFQ